MSDIFCRIGRDLRRDKASYSNDALQRDQEREAHKVVKVLTVVVIVFALLMLPNHVVFLWLDFGGKRLRLLILIQGELPGLFWRPATVYKGLHCTSVKHVH